MNETIPLVIYGNHQPEKLKRLLEGLRPQSVEKLIFLLASPEGEAEKSSRTCQEMINGVDWAEAELHSWEIKGKEDPFVEQISLIFQAHPWAIFLEDGCFPLPGFVQFMHFGLEKYQKEEQLFSISGYQPLTKSLINEDRIAVLCSARFNGFGWATWRDRWLEIRAEFTRISELFPSRHQVPKIAGLDVWMAARKVLEGETTLNWEMLITLSCLFHRKVHLLPVHGLVERTGSDDVLNQIKRTCLPIQKGLSYTLKNTRQMDEKPSWPDHPYLDCEYNDLLRDRMTAVRNKKLAIWIKRGENAVRRLMMVHPERYFDLKLSHPPDPIFKKRALFSYITHPFSILEDEPRFFRHINIWHAVEFVKVLNRMGYVVDVIDYRDQRYQPAVQYDLFVGHGGINFEIMAGRLSPSVPKIYFATGSYWKFHNSQEQFRFKDFKNRRGVDLPPDRAIQVSEENALLLSDGIVGIGNQFTRATYEKFNNITMINGTSLFDDFFDWCPKDYLNGRDHFLFFASHGNIHKGLDLVLESFEGMNQHLWIAAPLEKKFTRSYSNLLEESPNIHPLGWIQPRSASFYQVMRRCNFCILPTCSEGQSQSVVEAMNHGLIPIVTRMSGVDVEGFGYIIEKPDIDTIRGLVRKAAQSNEADCSCRSKSARDMVKMYYSEVNFSENLTQALERFLA